MYQRTKMDQAAGSPSIFLHIKAVRSDTGTGNTVIIRSWVCTGMGTGMGLPYPGNTIPFSTVLRVCVGMGCQSGG
jgi:hypothetical protein